eukprot:3816656-Lingulodinium_polyedra.AAC.1
MPARPTPRCRQARGRARAHSLAGTPPSSFSGYGRIPVQCRAVLTETPPPGQMQPQGPQPRANVVQQTYLERRRA